MVFLVVINHLNLPTVTTSRFLKNQLYSHFLTFPKSCNNQNSTFGTKRPCVQVTSLRPVKAPGNRVFMRFLGVSVYLWFPAFFAADPYRDPYGIWAGGFWPLGLSPFLCSGNSIPLCSICEAGLSGPDTSPEMPHAGVLAVWAGGFPLLPFAVDFGRT